MIVRAATLEDLPRLVVILQQEIAYQRQIGPIFDLSPRFNARRFTETKIDNPNEQLLIAEEDGRLLGYIDVRAFLPNPARSPRDRLRRWLGRTAAPPLFTPRHIVGRIEDCYVDDPFRRRGVGSALVREGLAWLHGKGVGRVELAVFTANDGGKVFWEKQGFSPFRLWMSNEIS
jgi:GNAT superfamily N-acetyltransferase